MSKMSKIFVIAVVALMCVATCTAIEQPDCYKNVKPPVWCLCIQSFEENNSTVQSTGFVMPSLDGLKALQSRR